MLSKYKNLKVREAKALGYRNMAKLNFIKTCRRRFILEYFGQVPKFSVVITVIIVVKRHQILLTKFMIY